MPISLHEALDQCARKPDNGPPPPTLASHVPVETIRAPPGLTFHKGISVDMVASRHADDLVLLLLHDEKRARSALTRLSSGAESGPWLVDVPVDVRQAAEVFDVELKTFYIVTWGRSINRIRSSLQQVLTKTRLVPLKAVSAPMGRAVEEVVLLSMRDAKSHQTELLATCGPHRPKEPWLFRITMSVHDAGQLFGETLREHHIITRKSDEGALRQALPKEYLSRRRLKVEKSMSWPV